MALWYGTVTCSLRVITPEASRSRCSFSIASSPSGKRHRPRSIDRRDGHVDIIVFGNPFPRLAFRQLRCQHRAGTIGGGLQAPTMIAHHQRVMQRECTADIRCAHLANAVPDDRRRLDAQLGEFGGQRNLQQEVGRLGVLGVLDAGFRFGFGHFGEDRPAGDLDERRIYLGRGARESTTRAEKFAAHAPPLWSHSAEDEHRFGPGGHNRATDRRCSGGGVVESLQQFVRVRARQQGPVLVMRSPAPCGRTEIVDRRRVRHGAAQSGGNITHRLFTGGRDREEANRELPCRLAEWVRAPGPG